MQSGYSSHGATLLQAYAVETPGAIAWDARFGWRDEWEGVEYDPHAADSVADAYAAGSFGVGAHWTCHRGVRDAIASWTAAQDDAGHCSFYGAVNVRKSRAYFLGLRRYWRAQGYRR